MKAWVLENICDLKQNSNPLRRVELLDPEPKDKDVLIHVSSCGVCHTELDEIEGRTSPSVFPMILGHQVVGKIVDKGSKVKKFKMDDRVGVGWIYSSCGLCEYCITGYENLCKDFRATGRDAFGGYAEYIVVPEESVFCIPHIFSDIEASPLLCAGAIGFRSLRLTGLQNGQSLGLTGFGASGHLVLKMVIHKYPDSRVYVFARSEKERQFALDLGAVWAGDTEDKSPERCHAIIDTTPVWKPIVEALRNLAPGGRLVINAIRKESADQAYLVKLDYPKHLWMEKEIKSVANVSRMDISGFLELAAEIPIKPDVQEYPFEAANEALIDLKNGIICGAKVLKIADV